MAFFSHEAERLGEAAGDWLQDGLADGEGREDAGAVEQLPTGTVIVHAEERQPGGVARYAPVSSADQKADLDRQLARRTEWALAKRLPIVDALKEVGSGMTGHRKGLLRLLRDPKVGVILVEHRDRLMRAKKALEALHE
ncbi:recombinase family protein [Methylacidimicrobium sp. B4]|uniref:recombinase family protein n=1 Tax=Methylacidimicrobium sp. B4 TaxID=2796139 RepID=UPI001F5DD479|nr:recombinase family protein [Methylacidimicrobium sp. B4]